MPDFHGTWYRVMCYRRKKLFNTLFAPCHGLTNALLQSMALEGQCCNQVWGWFTDKIYKENEVPKSGSVML